MKTKYYRYTLKGEHSAEDAQRKIGDAAGLVVRIESSGGETQVYVAGDGTATGAKKAASSDFKLAEVSEKDVTEIGRK